MIIRAERTGDADAVREANRLAFGTDEEARIVDLLRERCDERISLVAESDGVVVGHILFTPVTAAGVEGMGLAPMAVHPSHQRSGIGSALVRHGLEEVRYRGYPFVVVLGHASYYPRFGFERASAYAMLPEFDGVPDEAFMIAVFDREAVAKASGVVTYRPEFSIG